MHGAEAGPCCGRHRLRSHPRERSDSPAGLCPLCAGSSGCWLRGIAPAISAADRLGATLLCLQQHGNSQHESLPRPGQSCSVPSLASHLTATEYERSLLSVGQPLCTFPKHLRGFQAPSCCSSLNPHVFATKSAISNISQRMQRLLDIDWYP